MKQYITRAYNSFEKTPYGSLVKKSKEPRLKDEAFVYQNLPSNLLLKYFPKFVSYNEQIDENNNKTYNLELERLPAKNLGQILLEENKDYFFWKQIFESINLILKDFYKNTEELSSWEEQAEELHFAKDSRQMFFKKTETEFSNLKNNFPYFTKLCKEPSVKLNGITYRNFEQVWEQGKKEICNILKPDINERGYVHGDLCFSNILFLDYGNNEFSLKLVDPRGKFGETYLLGDFYYDLAKLSHSTNTGYEYFIYDRFKVEEVNPFEFSLTYTNECKKEANRAFEDLFFKLYDRKKIKLIEATIFIGMCARHFDSHERQLAMYLSGVKLLNEVVNE